MAKQTKAGNGTGGSNRRATFDITPEEFVTVWNSSRTAQEAATTLGMPKAIAQARASKYRKAGVNLKRMRRGGGKRLDVEGLNRLIAQLEAERHGGGPAVGEWKPGWPEEGRVGMTGSACDRLVAPPRFRDTAISGSGRFNCIARVQRGLGQAFMVPDGQQKP